VTDFRDPNQLEVYLSHVKQCEEIGAFPALHIHLADWLQELLDFWADAGCMPEHVPEVIPTPSLAWKPHPTKDSWIILEGPSDVLNEHVVPWLLAEDLGFWKTAHWRKDMNGKTKAEKLLEELVDWVQENDGDVDRGALEEATYELVRQAMYPSRVPLMVYNVTPMEQVDLACALLGQHMRGELLQWNLPGTSKFNTYG